MSRNVIVFGTTEKTRCYFKHAEEYGDFAKGWRPLVWTRDVKHATSWARATDARKFAELNFPHQDWCITVRKAA